MWISKRLGELISLDYGFALPTSQRDETGTVPVLGSNGKCGVHSEARVQGPGIVVGRKGSAGLVTWVAEDFWPIDTTYYVTLKERLVPKWIYYLLNNLELSKYKTSTGVPGLNRNDVYSLQVKVPSISEQRRIVEILDQADALRKQRTEADAKAARILPALFYQMFGDPATNLRGWPIVRIRKLVLPIERRDLVSQPDDNFTYIDIAGIDGQSGTIVETKELLGIDAPSRARQIVHKNDVIVSTVRPYLRATALIPQHLNNQICSTGFCVLRAKNGFGFGFLYALSRLKWFTDQLNARARGASYPAVTDRDILDLAVPRPDNPMMYKVLDGQILEYLDLQDLRKTAAKFLDRLFTVLLHRAFTGDLTSVWREAHMKELLQEMEHQARALA